jgi:hypothetical protein
MGNTILRHRPRPSVTPASEASRTVRPGAGRLGGERDPGKPEALAERGDPASDPGRVR